MNRGITGSIRLLARAVPLLAAAAIAGCGGGRSHIAGKEPIDKVYKVETNVDALKEWVSQKAKVDALVHIDIADDIAVFPESMRESMKNAADHLARGNVDVLQQISQYIEDRGIVNLGYGAGLFKRMIWVVPARVSVGQLPLETYKSFLKSRRGYSDEALSDLVSTDRYITGTLMGIPVTITTLEDLDAGDDEVILDIDLVYFLGVKTLDPEYRTGTRSTLNFLRELRSKNLKTRLVTIHLATGSGDNPMDIRFFGDIIADGLRDPSKLEPNVPEKWSMMMQAEDSLVAGGYRSAAALYERLVAANPNDPGLYFTLAMARGFAGDGAGSREALLGAYRLDGAYLRAFLQLAKVLGAQGKVEAGEEIINAPELANIMSEMELNFQKGIFYLTAQRPYDALTYLKRVAQQRPDDFALQTVLYQAYRQAQDIPQQTLTLEKLRRIDDARVRRDMPWVYKELGLLYEEAKLYRNAVESYEIYLVIAPQDTANAEIRRKIEKWNRLYK